jgi:S1-C subfamily serine protease
MDNNLAKGESEAAPPPKQSTSGKAITAFVLMLLGILTMGAGVGFLLILAGLIVGYLAGKDFRKHGALYKGRGWLTATWVMFWGLVIIVGIVLLSLTLPALLKAREAAEAVRSAQKDRSELAQSPSTEAPGESTEADAKPKLSQKVEGSAFNYSYFVPDAWRVASAKGKFDAVTKAGDGTIVGAIVYPSDLIDTEGSYEELRDAARQRGATRIEEPSWVEHDGRKWLLFTFEMGSGSERQLMSTYIGTTGEWAMRFALYAKKPPFDRDRELFTEIFETLKFPSSSAAQPSADSKQSGMFGTGFFVSPDGYLVTCHHVVEGASNIEVMTAQGALPARLVNVDATADLALLKVESTAVPMPIADSGNARLGSWVATVGYPNVDMQGVEPKFATGEIASLAGAMDDPNEFQISIPLQTGLSGAPIVNKQGEVLGVATRRLSPDERSASVGYATKSSFVRSLIEDSNENVRFVTGPFGQMSTEDIAEELAAAVTLVYAE